MQIANNFNQPLKFNDLEPKPAQLTLIDSNKDQTKRYYRLDGIRVPLLDKIWIVVKAIFSFQLFRKDSFAVIRSIYREVWNGEKEIVLISDWFRNNPDNLRIETSYGNIPIVPLRIKTDHLALYILQAEKLALKATDSRGARPFFLKNAERIINQEYSQLDGFALNEFSLTDWKEIIHCLDQLEISYVYAKPLVHEVLSGFINVLKGLPIGETGARALCLESISTNIFSLSQLLCVEKLTMLKQAVTLINEKDSFGLRREKIAVGSYLTEEHLVLCPTLPAIIKEIQKKDEIYVLKEMLNPSDGAKDQFTTTLKNIEPNQREGVIRFSMSYLSKLSDTSRDTFLEGIALVPENMREEVMEQIFPLIKNGGYVWHKYVTGMVISCKIPQVRRVDFFSFWMNSGKWITSNELKSLLDVFEKVDVMDRYDLLLSCTAYLPGWNDDSFVELAYIIPDLKRKNFLEILKECFDKHCHFSEIKNALRDISREEAGKLLTLCLPELLNLSEDEDLCPYINAIKHIPSNVREEEYKLFKTSFSNIEPEILLKLMQGLANYSKGDRKTLLTNLLPLIDILSPGKDFFYHHVFIDCFFLIPFEKQKEWLAICQRMIEGLDAPQARAEVIVALCEVIAGNQWISINEMEEIALLLQQTDNADKRSQIFSISFGLFPIEYVKDMVKSLMDQGEIHQLETDFNSIKQLALKLRPDLIHEVHRHFEEKLTLVTDPDFALAICQDIIDHKDMYSINEEDPLFQNVLHRLIAIEQPGDQNPYQLYSKLITQSTIQPDNILLVIAKMSNESFVFNRETFLGRVKENALTYRDLPQGIDKKALDHLFDSFEKRLATLDDDQKKKTTDYISQNKYLSVLSDGSIVPDVHLLLKNNFIKDDYIQSLLRIGHSNGVVPLQSARFIAILDYVKRESDQLCPGMLLTPGEEALFTVSTSIQNCPGGKSEGISTIYRWLVRDLKIELKTRQDSIAIGYSGRRKIDQLVQQLLQDTFVSLDYLKEVLDETEQEIKQGAHQSIFLKNLISHCVGLEHRLEFDLHTGVLYPKLFEKDLADVQKDVLEVFYRHFTPEKLVKCLIEDSKIKALIDLKASKDKAEIAEEIQKAQNELDDPSDVIKKLIQDQKQIRGSDCYYRDITELYQKFFGDGKKDFWVEMELNDVPQDLKEFAEERASLPFILTEKGANDLLLAAGYLKTL